MNEVEIVAAWIGVAGAAAVGLVGWVLAGVANNRAKRANVLAAEANVQAARSAAAAERSAAEAEEATEFARRQAEREAEHHFVEWAHEWDELGCRILLTNRGRDVAHKVSVMVNGTYINQTQWFDDPVERGGPVVLDYPDLVIARNAHNEAARASWNAEKDRYAKRGIFSMPDLWSDSLDIVVAWKSELGRPFDQRFTMRVS